MFWKSQEKEKEWKKNCVGIWFSGSELLACTFFSSATATIKNVEFLFVARERIIRLNRSFITRIKSISKNVCGTKSTTQSNWTEPNRTELNARYKHRSNEFSWKVCFYRLQTQFFGRNVTLPRTLVIFIDEMAKYVVFGDEKNDNLSRRLIRGALGTVVTSIVTQHHQ